MERHGEVLKTSSWLSTWMIILHPIHFSSGVNFAIIAMPNMPANELSEIERSSPSNSSAAEQNLPKRKHSAAADGEMDSPERASKRSQNDVPDEAVSEGQPSGEDKGKDGSKEGEDEEEDGGKSEGESESREAEKE